MKKLVTSLCFFILSISMFGQFMRYPSKTLQQIDRHNLDDWTEYYSNYHMLSNGKSYSQLWKLKSSEMVKQRLDSAISETIEDKDEWIFESKDVFIYNQNGFCTEYLSYEYNIIYGFQLYTKFEFFSVDNINLTLVTLYDWDKDKSKWENDYKYEYEYHNNGLLKQYITYFWDDDSQTWNTYQKSRSIYNETGQLLAEIYSEYDKDSAVWIDYMKTELKYNTELVKTESTMSVYDEDEKKWFTLNKNEFSYNSKGFMTLLISFRWDFETETWGNSTKEEYVYDVHDNMISSIVLNWDDNESTWVYNWKNDIKYNDDFAFSDLLLPQFFTINYPFEHIHMPVESSDYEWDENEETWIPIWKDRSYYSPFNTTDISNNMISQIRLFPNPVDAVLSIKLPVFSMQSTVGGRQSISIFDLSGKQILEKELVIPETQIDVRHLNGGVYICRITSDNKQTIATMIKR